MVLVLLAVPALSLLFLQNRQVQTMVTKYVASEISNELRAKVSLSSVSYSFFKRVQVRDLYLEDLNGDTLIYSELTKIRIKQWRPDRSGMDIKRISVENAWLNLTIDSSGVVNLSFITDRFSNPHVPSEMKSKFHIGTVEMINGRFSLSDVPRKEITDRVNFSDLDLEGLQIRVEDLTSYMDTVSMEIVSLEGRERSGFDIGKFSASLALGKTFMHFRHVDILTPSSELHLPVVAFNFDQWNQFSQFSRKVDLEFQSVQSRLSMADLGFFVPLSVKLIDRIDLDGRVDGKLSDLRGNELQVTFNENSTLAFDFTMIGLPDLSSTFIDFNFQELNTSVAAVRDLFSPVESREGSLPYPWNNLGNLDFRGKFTGYPDNFVANGFLATNMGDLIMDLSFRPDTVQGVDFKGRLNTRNFKLGEFLEKEELLASLDMDVMTDGSLRGGKIRAKLTGTVDTLEFYRYAYSNIMLDGEFTNTTFNGGFSISDPNISMDFLGTMDFSGQAPVYRFTADVARARPFYLNLVPEEPNSFVSFLIETDLTGRTLDELNGKVRLVNSLFERKNAQLQLYDIDIETRNTADTSWLKISSEMLDAWVEGKYQLTKLPSSFKNLGDRYLDVDPSKEPEADTLHHLAYRFQFKKMEPLFDFFYPSLYIGEGSELHGQFDPSRYHFTSNGFLSKLRLGKNEWSNVDLFSETNDAQFSLHFQSDSLTLGGNYSLVEQQFNLLAAQDAATLEISWDNRVDPRYSGEILLSGALVTDSSGERGMMVEIQPTELQINSEPWYVGHSSVLVKNKYLLIDSLSLAGNDKYLIADGVISSRTDQDFNLRLKNLQLSELSGLAGLNATLEGNITGYLNYKQLEGTPYVFSDLQVDTLSFNRQLLGPTRLTAAWNETRNNIRLQLLSDMNGNRLVEVDGTYTPGSHLIDMDVQLNHFDLSSLDPYSGDVFSELGGTGDVRLTVDGTLKEPQINGEIWFNQGGATLFYLNTRYNFNDRIRVLNNNLYFEDFHVADSYGNSAVLNGSLSNTYLTDFYLNLNMEVNNLLCMNTGPIDNDDFYGTIFASGTAELSGRLSNLNLKLNATTRQNTALYLPLYNAREVANSDFITFTSGSDETETDLYSPQIGKLSGLEMDMDVDITPDAVVQLIFDPQVGDIIETSGQGTLRMTFDPINGFRMLGDVELVRGDYLFTLQNVINKRFQISPGGKLYFNGDPTEATIDLEAIYTTRTAPYNLYPGDPNEASESLKRRIPVECHLNLQGDLRSPSITTGIEMPTADPETRNLLENSTSTEEEMMRQFLSLLVINNFYSVSGYGGQNVGNLNTYIAGVTASELLSNQLSNWLSQISDDFDIGVNYRPGDEISSDEVEVALSTQLLDDRIIISGNVDVGGQQTNPSSTASNNPYIMGDFDVEFRVTDNVSVIAFNRARDELLFETAPYKQGVGVSYREEFDNLRQLMQRYREGLTNRKKKRRNSDEPESVE